MLLVAGALVASAQQENSSSPPEPKQNATELLEHQSVFEEPLRPPYTDPFFPQSKRMPYRAVPTVVSTSQPQVATIDHIILKGVSVGGGKRTALINRKNFAAGESGTVQTPRGPVNIEVLEVRDRSVLIKVENDPDPKEIHLSPEP